jgi:hypothetical protein
MNDTERISKTIDEVLDTLIEDHKHETDLFRTIRAIEEEGNLHSVKPELKEWYEKQYNPNHNRYKKS